jgi:hypothetical protein
MNCHKLRIAGTKSDIMPWFTFGWDCDLMPDSTVSSRDADACRLALDVIATLANVKKTAADQLVRPAGVPGDLIRRFLKDTNPVTGEKRSKREAGAAILEELAKNGQEMVVVRKLIALAAKLGRLSSRPRRVQGARGCPEGT